MSDDLSVLLDVPSPTTLARERAVRIKDLERVELPKLRLWNYEPCERHPEPDVYCRACGGAPWNHQSVGISWLYFARSGLLADETGLGKTVQALGVLALMKQRGELDRALIVCQAGAIADPWLQDLRRFTPALRARAAIGSARERHAVYASKLDVIVLGFPALIRDYDVIRRHHIDVLISDDVQPLLHMSTKTARAFNALARDVERVISMNATPLNLKLQDIYALVAPMGGREVFGSLRQFENHYVRYEETVIRTGRRRTRVRVEKGYQHMEEFREKVRPFVLRRKYSDVHDVRIPDVLPPQNVWLDLYPEQRARYKDLQDGVLKLRAPGAEKVSRVDVLQRFGHGQRIIAGLHCLGETDLPGKTSAKLDWMERQMTTDWAEEKAVCFVINRASVEALRDRMRTHGIEVALIWGQEGDSKKKAALRKVEQERFWDDPRCRLAIGTTAIERSMNFQNARIVIAYDMLLNPSRMLQILGRVRRAGSRHEHVLPVNLLTPDTQESRYLNVLAKRAAIADFVLDDQNPLYKLSTAELLALISP